MIEATFRKARHLINRNLSTGIDAFIFKFALIIFFILHVFLCKNNILGAFEKQPIGENLILHSTAQFV